jgi:subtilisin family serine protease
MYGNCYFVEGTGSSCYDDRVTTDSRGHGAHVAGIIAGNDNPYGYIGIANNLQTFVSIKVCDAAGWCDPDAVASGLNWVVGSGLSRHVVNMSLGYCRNYTLLNQLVVSAANSGALLIGSAGNHVQGEVKCPEASHLRQISETEVMWPARYNEVMAVSGTLEDDAFAAAPPQPPGGGGGDPTDPCSGGLCPPTDTPCGGGSRYGPQVEISAPFSAGSMWGFGQYRFVCGTSMAAPHVSSTAALVWSRNPTWTSAQVKQHLKSTAVSYQPSEYFGAGRVDAANALQPPPPTLSVSIYGPTEIRPGSTCTWEASVGGGSGPFSYQWTNDGHSVGTASSYTGAKLDGSIISSFRLKVFVTDPSGSSGEHEITVYEESSAPECLI